MSAPALQEIDAETQIFTPRYVAKYLAENAIGRLWVNSRPNGRLADNMGRPSQRGSKGDLMLPSAVAQLLPTPSVADAAGGHERRGGNRGGELLLKGHGEGRPPARFGPYAPAIASHERLAGRPSPDPTEPGPRGKPRLSARFAEWMMCIPDGLVSDVPGLSRSAQLALLGNGVCPPQAVAALHHMLDGAA